MSASKRLTRLFKYSDVIEFDDSSKFILLSDCHRGDKGYADDFVHNENIFLHALHAYYVNGFTYIEIGDGDELWENKEFVHIWEAYEEVFSLMQQFYQQGRLYLIFGNHDMERKNPKKVEKTLFNIYNKSEKKLKLLFQGIKIHEGLKLKYLISGEFLFLAHGHQVDMLATRFWRFSRFFVRHFWRHLQQAGFGDPTSPAINQKKREKVEKKLEEWANENRQILIVGHTHRPVFPKDSSSLYFNTGCCIHPHSICGIEIENGEIKLVKWSIKTESKSGYLKVFREEIEKPKMIIDLFKDEKESAQS